MCMVRSGVDGGVSGLGPIPFLHASVHGASAYSQVLSNAAFHLSVTEAAAP